jgi:hypothetical protein
MKIMKKIHLAVLLLALSEIRVIGLETGIAR